MKKLMSLAAVLTVVVSAIGFTARPASANFPDGVGDWADQVFSYNPGLDGDRQPIAAGYNDPWQALGPAEGAEAGTIIPATSAVSLGYRGQIVLKFDQTLLNLPGKDFKVIAAHTDPTARFRNRPIPAFRAVVAVSQNCWKYYDVGTVRVDGSFDLGGLRWAKCIRITDRSDRRYYPITLAGYRLDGVMSLHSTPDQYWDGTMRDARWWRIDADKTNDLWLGHSLSRNLERNGFCYQLWTQAVTFHNNWEANPVSSTGVPLQSTYFSTIGLSTYYDGISTSALYDKLSTMTCTSTSYKDVSMRNLLTQLQRINSGRGLWITATTQ